MTDPDNDDFETYLKRRTVLPNAMSVDDKLEPPTALDEVVLRNAREAIQAQRKPQSQRAPRWATPLAIAATVLLCLSVVLNISLNTNHPNDAVSRVTAEAAGDRADQAPAVARAQSDEQRREKLAGNAESQPEQIASADARKGAASAPPAASAPASSAPISQAASTAKAPAPPRSSPPALSDNRLADAASEPSQLDARTAAAPPPSPDPSDNRPDTVAAPSSAPTTAALAEGRIESPAVTTTRALAKRQADANAPPSLPRDPKVWLKQIEVLRTEGKTAQADAEMRRFRAAFPTYPAKPESPAASEPRR